MEKVAKNRVVVVGGGVAGALVAKELQFVADVVLVDPKEYFEIPWANLRSMVEPSFAERTIINHKDYLINGKIVVSSAIDVTEANVLTSTGRLLPYDYVVIATGHDNPSYPTTQSERLQQFKADKRKIEDSPSVLIVGGGPTGVELAGEIAVDFPQKKVTLVHKGPRLLEFIGPNAGKKALNWLEKKNVQVLLEQTLETSSSDSDKVFHTSSGESLSADCYYPCIGRPLSSSWLDQSIIKDCIDNRGQIMVDEHLRVRGLTNVFAVGDITDIPEIKQGYLAQQHARVVVKNLKILMGFGRGNVLTTYKPATSPIAIVSLGRKEAVIQLPFATIGGYLPGFIKSRDLFVGKTRKVMGLNPKGPEVHT